MLNKEPVEVFSLLLLFFDSMRQIDEALDVGDQRKERRGAHRWEVVVCVEQELVKGFDDDVVKLGQGLLGGIEEGVEGSFKDLVA